MKNVIYVAKKPTDELTVDLYCQEYSELNPWGLSLNGNAICSMAGRTKEHVVKSIEGKIGLIIVKVTISVTEEIVVL